MQPKKEKVTKQLENDLPGFSHFEGKYKDLEVKAAANVPKSAIPITAFGGVAGITIMVLAKIKADWLPYAVLAVLLTTLALLWWRMHDAETKHKRKDTSEPRAGP